MSAFGATTEFDKRDNGRGSALGPEHIEISRVGFYDCPGRSRDNPATLGLMS